MLVRVRFGDRREDALAGMTAREAEHALDQTNGADTARGQCGVGPLFEHRPDTLTLPDQAIDKRLLACRGLSLAGTGRKHAGRDPRMHHDERVPLEDAHQLRVPLHAETLAK